MNSNIDFSDFSKIQIENKPKCRKFTKNKITMFIIFLTLINIILISLIANNNSKYNKKTEELSKVRNSLSEIDSQILTLINKTENARNALVLLKNSSSINKTEAEIIKAEYANLEQINEKLKYKRNDLLAKKEYILNLINYKQKSLKEDELRIEIQEKQNLLQKMKQRFKDLSISNSNILTNAEYFESLTDTEILNKCYDSEVYGFHVNWFHDNCDGYPLLILIKTKKGEKIGAFTSKPNNGIKNITDDKSLLINFDENKYFVSNIDDNKCFVYCDVDMFPRFGNDLIIYRDGHGESKFPECYNIKGQNVKGEFIDENFNIDIMEIYTVKLKPFQE